MTPKRATGIPEVGRTRNLLSDAWTGVEVPAGALKQRSARFPGAWSTAALLVHTSTKVFVCCDSVDWQGGERLTLRFFDGDSEAAISQLRGARPAFAAMHTCPVELKLLEGFFSVGPTAAEMGFGPATSPTGSHPSIDVVPVLWCCLSNSRGTLMIYADGEVPLNVGLVTNPTTIDAIKRELKADFVLAL